MFSIYDKIKKEAAQMGLEVIETNCASFFDPDDSLIGLDASMPIEEKTYTLIHEMGHAYLHFDEEEYEINFPAKCRPSEHSFEEWKEDVYREEVEAWEIGLWLVEDIKGIDVVVYNSLKERCLKDYTEYLDGLDGRIYWLRKKEEKG